MPFPSNFLSCLPSVAGGLEGIGVEKNPKSPVMGAWEVHKIDDLVAGK